MSQNSKSAAKETLINYKEWQEHHAKNILLLKDLPFGKDKQLMAHFENLNNAFDEVTKYLSSRIKDNG